MKNLKEVLKSHNLPCDDEKIEQFNMYYDLLVDWNQRLNLTSITEPNEVLVKHFFDSITPALYLKFTNQQIIDIGAGAGFPSIPLKICFPNLNITMLDSLNKRIIFLNNIIDSLKLNNIICVHGRAEELARKELYREKYDLAISRAVARLNIITELSLPFVKKGGKMVALKGSKAEEEIDEAKNAINLLGGVLETTFSLNLPGGYGDRTIIIINKRINTSNKFPRKPGTPNRNPII